MQSSKTVHQVEGVASIYQQNSICFFFRKSFSHSVYRCFRTSIVAGTRKGDAASLSSSFNKTETVLPIIHLSTSPIPIGRMPGFLSSGNSLHDVKLSSKDGWYDGFLQVSCHCGTVLSQKLSLRLKILRTQDFSAVELCIHPRWASRSLSSHCCIVDHYFVNLVKYIPQVKVYGPIKNRILLNFYRWWMFQFQFFHHLRWNGESSRGTFFFQRFYGCCSLVPQHQICKNFGPISSTDWALFDAFSFPWINFTSFTRRFSSPRLHKESLHSIPKQWSLLLDVAEGFFKKHHKSLQSNRVKIGVKI